MAKQLATPADWLTTPLQFLKGVGEHRASILARLGLNYVQDALFYFPRDYQDLVELDSVADLVEDKIVRLRGTVVEAEQRVTGAGRSMLGVLVQCIGGNVRCLWFNQPFMAGKFTVGQEVLLAGKPRYQGAIWQFVHPHVRWLRTEEQAVDSGLLPVYGLTEGLAQHQIRRVTRAALDVAIEAIDEVFPPEHRAEHGLIDIHQALESIHYPADREALDRARRRLVYGELFVLELALAVRRAQRSQHQATPLDATTKIDARIRRLFDFAFTPAQDQAIAELRADLARSTPMNRLLQGEVGSGKTVVALYGVLTAVACGCQAAIMAPTEILARQHADTLGRVLSQSKVRWDCLTGATTDKARREMLEKARTGELDVLIGTQAILERDVEFARLALVVIDEQHKFGVRARATLRQTSSAPHYLVMTATPIPRTTALTLYGDLDISTLRDAPPGRQPVKTYLAAADQRDKWWEFFRRKLDEGRQGYVITPQVDSDELTESDVPPPGAEQVYESLAHGPLEAYRVGVLHGRMSSREKEAVMADFRSGRLQVLVATTVIEVGIDVPNATLLTIESGQSFGLAQLHQLRGRISRGTHPGFCCVFADPKTAESQRRLEAFEQSTDGFYLAEIDFELRGPGNVLGTKQHGLPPFRIADLVRDREVLEETRLAAESLLAADPDLSHESHHRLRDQMQRRYGKVLELGDVG